MSYTVKAASSRRSPNEAPFKIVGISAGITSKRPASVSRLPSG